MSKKTLIGLIIIQIFSSLGCGVKKNENNRVKIFKFDGSLQCEMGKLIELDEMKKELEPIQVYFSFKSNTGGNYCSSCGCPTGEINVYEIDKTSLEIAKSKDFLEWKILENYNE